MGRKVAKISVSKALYAIDKPYTYLIPPELEEKLRPGMRVLVPFGNGNRQKLAVIFDLSDTSDSKNTKPIFSTVS